MTTLIRGRLAVSAVVVLLTARASGNLFALVAPPVSASAFLAAAVPAAPMDLTQADVDALIAKLNDNDFDVRQAAQAELIRLAGLNIDNARLVKARIKAIGITSNNLEVKTRSEDVLKGMIPLGLLKIQIDDVLETLGALSDGDNTRIEIDPGIPEVIRVFDPFFEQFVGPTKTVYMVEAGAPLVDGLTQASDVIGFTPLFGHALIFNSDGEDEKTRSKVDCTQADVVCIPETGAPQEVAKLIFGDKVGFLSILVASDAEAPEPSTIVLTATGLSVVLVHGWRRRRSRRRTAEIEKRQTRTGATA